MAESTGPGLERICSHHLQGLGRAPDITDPGIRLSQASTQVPHTSMSPTWLVSDMSYRRTLWPVPRIMSSACNLLAPGAHDRF